MPLKATLICSQSKFCLKVFCVWFALAIRFWISINHKHHNSSSQWIHFFNKLSSKHSHQEEKFLSENVQRSTIKLHFWEFTKWNTIFNCCFLRKVVFEYDLLNHAKLSFFILLFILVCFESPCLCDDQGCVVIKVPFLCWWIWNQQLTFKLLNDFFLLSISTL